MFDSIIAFVTAHAAGVASFVVSFLLFGAYLASLKFRLWVRDFLVTLPVVGDLARLSKDRTQGSDGWLRAEEKLCSVYKPYIELMEEEGFNNRIEYLRKSADLGRTPTPFFVWLVLVVLVIAEGLGFSYLLGSWMAREGSADTHTLLMFAIVLVLCVILVAITHFAGHQYYRTSLLRSCFARFKDLGSNEYAVKSVSLNRDQSVDDAEPEFKQIVNRVAKHSHDKGSYAGGVIAIIAIIVIGVGSTYMRMKNLEVEMVRESAAMAQDAGSNPFASSSLPIEITEPQHAADKKAQSDAQSATVGEGIAAFVILGFIFVITQIVGMGAGYKYGFAGRESKDAYVKLGGAATYEDYFAYFQPLRDLVNSRLKDLQQRIEEKSHTKLALTKTFGDYLLEQKRQNQILRYGVNTPSNTVQPASAAPTVVPAAAAPNVSTAPAAEPIIIETAKVGSELDDAKAQLILLNNPDKEKEYFLSLPMSLRGDPELQQWLKNRKAEREAAAKLAVDDLF